MRCAGGGCGWYCSICGYGNKAITAKNAGRYGYKVSRLTGQSYSAKNNNNSINNGHGASYHQTKQIKQNKNQQSNYNGFTVVINIMDIRGNIRIIMVQQINININKINLITKNIQRKVVYLMKQ